MKQALLEAFRAMGNTGKNPNVGCVLVKNNFIIARARTSPGGRPHAEENLIKQLSDLKKVSFFLQNIKIIFKFTILYFQNIEIRKSPLLKLVFFRVDLYLCGEIFLEEKLKL